MAETEDADQKASAQETKGVAERHGRRGQKERLVAILKMTSLELVREGTGRSAKIKKERGKLSPSTLKLVSD